MPVKTQAAIDRMRKRGTAYSWAASLLRTVSPRDAADRQMREELDAVVVELGNKAELHLDRAARWQASRDQAVRRSREASVPAVMG